VEDINAVRASIRACVCQGGKLGWSMMQLGKSCGTNAPCAVLALVVLGACSSQDGTVVAEVDPTTTQEVATADPATTQEAATADPATTQEAATADPATTQEPNCSEFVRAEPVDLEVSASVIATEPNLIWHLTELSPPLIADGGGVYWHDTYGSLSAQRRGDPGVVQLLEGTAPVEGDTRNRYMLGMATNASGVSSLTAIFRRTHRSAPTSGVPADGKSDLRGLARTDGERFGVLTHPGQTHSIQLRLDQHSANSGLQIDALPIG